ncbi:protein TolQ [Lysobacter capsici]|jgi:biopolymer transport protein TolQ|uniref:Tol-Pal system protein TolQ n=1 Tax=Lysobacter capsici AZ78 TaxID=1444315 RepID=A0A108UDA2_9GAMM|nr:protein TolQ [Lysobacter capsici]KWS06780.1 MotA/TolQ/ExbB proton channel family protein [Lysobacter capsici AZ78]UOF13852.1 protein TolQ [Lysobacter capsici]
MTSSLIALLATTVQALPEEAVQAVTDGAQAAGKATTEFSLWPLIANASIPVQLIMGLLVIASITSWVIIFRKWRVIRRARIEADHFEERFWSGAELSKLYAGTTERSRSVGGLEAIFEAGFREFNRIRQRRGVDARAQLEGAQRAMRATGSRELDGLEHNLELLANIGSTSPYIGLVGTVFGIMVTMHSLVSASKQVGIADVAPGISEALLATAMGLFVAIPAVWAYNRYATSVERLAVRYDAFSEEFSSILQRQTHLDE